MAKFCPECGSPLKENAKFCENCGAHVPEQASGKPAVPTPAPQAPTPENDVLDMPETGAAEHVQTTENRSKTVPQMPKSSVKVPEQFANRNKVNMPKSSVKVPEQFAAKARERAETHSSGGKKQPPANENGERTQKKSTKSYGAVISCVAVVLVVAFLFTAFIAPGFLRAHNDGGTDGGDGSGDTSLEVKEKSSGQVSESSPVVTLCGVKVDVVPEMLASGSSKVTVSKLEDSTEDGVKSENYELEMGDHRKFDIPVEVTFPCKITDGYDPTVEHFNDETGEWDPLISFVDEESKTVKAYFGSFCKVRVSYLPKGKDPKIYRIVTDPNNKFAPQIGVAANYWNILQRINPEIYGEEVTRFINNPENYAVPFPELDPKMDAKAAYEAFTKSSTMWTFIDPIINLSINELPSQGQNAFVKFIADNAESLGNAMNVIPFIVMGAQVAFDLNSGEPDAEKTAAVNLYKNLITSGGTIYSLSTGYSHIGFTLAFFGVALFGMELDYLVDAAKAEQKANVKSVFESYYTNTAPFDALHWYEVFEKAYWDNDGNAEAAMRDVKEAVDAYCSQFWTRIYADEGSDEFWETLSDSKYRKIFMNASEEDKAALTEQQKARVWNLIQKHSMKIIRRFLYERIQEDTRKELYSKVEKYNKKRNIVIKETVNRGAEAELTGYTVCFGYGNDLVPYPGWHVNIPDDGEYDDGWRIEFDYTTLGYMQMGIPDRVLFYDSEADFNEAVRTQGKGERPSYSYPCVVDLKSADPGTLVEINFGDPYQAKSDSFTGYTWHPLGYGGEISANAVNGAIEDAIRKATFKLDKDGKFSVTSTGGYSKSSSGDTGPNDTAHYEAGATVTLKGQIDRSTGDGTFEVNITVTYSHNSGSPYSGTDSVSAAITIKGGGKINGDIDGEDTFDPKFGGDVTVHRQGSWSHSKGTAQWDQDGHETINNTEDSYVEILFIANN